MDEFDLEEWDNVTVVSLESIPEYDHRFLPFLGFTSVPLGRRRPASAPKFYATSALRQASTLWKTSVRSIRRSIPVILRTFRAGISATLVHRQAVVISESDFSASVSAYQCAACQTNIDLMDEDYLLVPCGHQYHVECMLTLVETSMQTLSTFPPRCCRQDIPLQTFERYLPAEQHARFIERRAEHNTPKRVYCANPHCSRFLGARDKNVPVRVLACPGAACSTRTCARCKGALAAHVTPARHKCAHDEGHRAALRLGGRMGWVRCPGCEELIERRGGCAHMTCVCGAQFCFRCRARWKTCVCVDWGDGVGADAGEARLFAPLEEGGDLGARLALWVPPTLERAATRSSIGFTSGSESRRGSGESTLVSGSGSGGEGEGSRQIDPRPMRPRSQSYSFIRAETLQAVANEVVGFPTLTAAVEASPKTSPSSISSPLATSARTDDEVAAACLGFPFFIDPSVIARGVHAQEIRRRGRAMSL